MLEHKGVRLGEPCSELISRRSFMGAGLGLIATTTNPYFHLIKTQTIRIVYSTKFIPLSYLDTNNRMRGFYVELFDEILGRRMGFNVEHIGLPWKRAQLLVEHGDADVFCTNATITRQAYMNFCQEKVIENRRMVIFKRGTVLDNTSDTPIDLSELKGFRHISYLGNGWAKSNLKEFDVEWADTSSSAMKILAQGQADVFVTGEYQALYRIKSLGLEDQLQFRPITTKKKSLHRLGIRKSYPDSKKQVDIFCGHLENMKMDGDFNRLLGQFV
ncbi:MAG: transporter substrate-binding domain-containing protein [Halopseudomonas aestusnigri]